MSLSRPVLGAALALLAHALPLAAQSLYTVTDLGTLGGTLSAATSINASGVVAGYSTPAFGSSLAFSWSNGVMTNLGSAGGRWSYGYGINASGTVVGHANVFTAAGYRDQAFVHAAGSATLLPTLGGDSGYALSVNDTGVVVGNAFLAGNSTRHAFRYSGGTITDLTPDIGARNSYAHDINASGWIVGALEVTNALDERAFIDNGTSRAFLGLGGTRSRAYAINDAGRVVGQSTLTGNVVSRGFFFDSERVHQLGSLGGNSSAAYDINNSDQIVGSSTVAGELELRATLFLGTEAYDLNQLLVSNPGWLLVEARGINDEGKIVGYGMIDGQQHAFLLTPVAVPEPSALLLLGGASVGLWLGRRRALALRDGAGR